MDSLDELLAQKEIIADKIQVLENEFEPGKKKILTAIKLQRFYFFKNKPKVFMDKDTALLWVNLDYYSYSGDRKYGGYPKLKKEEVKSYIEEINKTLLLDGFSGWHIPDDRELRYLIAKNEYTYPFRDKIKTTSENWYWLNSKQNFILRLHDIIPIMAPVASKKDMESCAIVNIWNIGKSHPKRFKRAKTFDEILECTYFYSTAGVSDNSKASIWPCSDSIVPDGYIHNISESNLALTEDKRLEITLDIFTNNNLIPKFYDEENTTLYCRLYLERKELYKQLSVIEEKIKNLQTVELQSATNKGIVVFDSKAVLEKINIETVNTTAERYYEAIRTITNNILTALSDYKKAKESVIRDALNIKLKFVKNYNQYENLDYQEKELLEKRQQFFKERLDLGLVRLEERIRGFKKEADDYFVKLEESYYNDYGIYEGTEQGFKPKISFEQFLNIVESMIRRTLKNVEFFCEKERVIKSILTYWDTWDEEYRLLKGDNFRRLKTICEEAGIEEINYKEWYKDWTQKRFITEERFLPFVVFVFEGHEGHLLIERDNLSLAEKILNVLSDYKKELDAFYLTERKNIHQKIVVQNGDSLLENVETEIEVYRIIDSFQKKLTAVIFECTSTEEKSFLLRWAMPLLNLPLDMLIQYANDQEVLEMVKVAISELSALKQRNLMDFLADCTAFNTALQIREKEFYDIAYRMKKGLEKK